MPRGACGGVLFPRMWRAGNESSTPRWKLSDAFYLHEFAYPCRRPQFNLNILIQNVRSISQADGGKAVTEWQRGP